MGFFGQEQVYNQENAAVPGDRASQNPMATYDAGPGGLVAGLAGVIVGNFAWVTPPTDTNGTDQIANSTGFGNVAGFVYNDLQALDTVFLSGSTLVIPAGLPVALAVQGDFWVVNNGTTEAIPGVSKAYANFADGSVTFAATATPTSIASATGSTVTPETNSGTGGIVNDVVTFSAVTGSMYPGTTISGTGITTGTQIAVQI